MVLLKSFVLAGLAVAVSAKSAVLDLIPDNFDEVVLKSGKPTLVEFFAPWCGHCKNLAPIYEDLAQVFEFAKDKVQIAKVDADAERSLGKRFGVQGFPTLKWFDGKSDKPEDYSGGRDLESLSAFISEKTGVKARRKVTPPSNIVMLSDTTFPKEIGGDKDVLVAFTAPWCGRKCPILCSPTPRWQHAKVHVS
jgi:protein disulfide-isomerase A6